MSPQNPLPVRDYPELPSGADNVTPILMQTLRPLATAGLVIVFAIFMMLKREDLRDRVIRLTSRGRVNFSTQAVDEAAARISRYLLTQLCINTAYGLAVALGLWIIGLTLGAAEGGFPNVLLWALLCGVLRFVPYVGPVIGAAFPLAIAFGFFHNNSIFLVALMMFVGLEIFVSQFIEPQLYRSSTGISALAILVSAVFWTAVWGPSGLLLSMPLTVMLVVMGKYVPQLKFLDILLGDEPVLAPPERIYQRLLALDQEEAVELAQEYAKDRSAEALYEEVLIPVLTMSTHDRYRGKLDSRRQRFIHKSLRVIVEESGRDAATAPRPGAQEPLPLQTPGDKEPGGPRPEPSGQAPQPPVVRVQVPVGRTVNVLILPAGEEADEIAGLMLAQLLEGRGYTATVASASSLVGEVLAMIEQGQAHVVCVSAMPPGSVARARYLCKRLHEKHADLRIHRRSVGFPRRPGPDEQPAGPSGAGTTGHQPAGRGGAHRSSGPAVPGGRNGRRGSAGRPAFVITPPAIFHTGSLAALGHRQADSQKDARTRQRRRRGDHGRPMGSQVRCQADEQRRDHQPQRAQQQGQGHQQQPGRQTDSPGAVLDSRGNAGGSGLAGGRQEQDDLLESFHLRAHRSRPPRTTPRPTAAARLTKGRWAMESCRVCLALSTQVPAFPWRAETSPFMSARRSLTSFISVSIAFS